MFGAEQASTQTRTQHRPDTNATPRTNTDLSPSSKANASFKAAFQQLKNHKTKQKKQLSWPAEAHRHRQEQIHRHAANEHRPPPKHKHVIQSNLSTLKTNFAAGHIAVVKGESRVTPRPDTGLHPSAHASLKATFQHSQNKIKIK